MEIVLMVVRLAIRKIQALHMAVTAVLVVVKHQVEVPHTLEVQMVVTAAVQMVVTEKAKGLQQGNLVRLTENCTLAVEAGIIAMATLLAAMVAVQTVDSRHRIIPVAVLAVQLNKLLRAAAPASLLSESIRRRQHEIRNRN